jgi:hypothetical protein
LEEALKLVNKVAKSTSALGNKQQEGYLCDILFLAQVGFSNPQNNFRNILGPPGGMVLKKPAQFRQSPQIAWVQMT